MVVTLHHATRASHPSPSSSPRSRAVFVVGPILALAASLSGCSSSSSSSSSPSCYVTNDTRRCTCSATNDDATYASSAYTKVSGCTPSTMGTSIICTADTKVDGTTTTCGCSPVACIVEGDRCSCGQVYEAADPSSVSCSNRSAEQYEWCCASDDGSSCYCSNGVTGSACANGEQSVLSCGLSSVKPSSSERTNCDGLTWAAPTPSTGGGGGGGGGDDDAGECSSSSECMGKCSTRCYDCRSKSCVCGRIGSSGSCIY